MEFDPRLTSRFVCKASEPERINLKKAIIYSLTIATEIKRSHTVNLILKALFCVIEWWLLVHIKVNGPYLASLNCAQFRVVSPF